MKACVEITNSGLFFQILRLLLDIIWSISDIFTKFLRYSYLDLLDYCLSRLNHTCISSISELFVYHFLRLLHMFWIFFSTSSNTIAYWILILFILLCNVDTQLRILVKLIPNPLFWKLQEIPNLFILVAVSKPWNRDWIGMSGRNNKALKCVWLPIN